MRPREYRNAVEVAPEAHELCPTCGGATERASLVIYQSGSYRVIPVRSINALVARDKYLEVVTPHGVAGLAELSLDQISRMYPRDWHRVHRSALVRLNAVLEVRHRGGRHTNAEVFVAGCDRPILVAKRRAGEFRRAILGVFTSRHQDVRKLA